MKYRALANIRDMVLVGLVLVLAAWCVGCTTVTEPLPSCWFVEEGTLVHGRVIDTVSIAGATYLVCRGALGV